MQYQGSTKQQRFLALLVAFAVFAVFTIFVSGTVARAQPPDTERTPFRQALLNDPACDNQSMFCIDESFYFTYADSPPNPAAMEFWVNPGGLGHVKVGPRRPDLVLQDPQLISFTDPANPPPQLLGLCPLLEPGPPATPKCFADPFGGADICPVRELWNIFGYYVTVTYDPNGVQELEDPIVQFQCLQGTCQPNPRVTAPMISITTPATTGGPYLDPVDGNLDGVRDGVASFAEICADSTLSFLQVGQISTLQVDGVVINVRNASLGGNHLSTDLIATLIGARYGQWRFSKFNQTPMIFHNGGSWGTGPCLATTLMHPELVQGCIGSASLPDVTEFKNHMIWDSNAQGLLTGMNTPANDGTSMTSGLDRGLTFDIENTQIPHVAQVMSPAHRTADMETAIFMCNSDGDFSSDAYGATNKALEAELANLGKSNMYRLKLVPNRGHGIAIQGSDFVSFLLDQLYPQYLDVLANPPSIDPFGTDSPETGEDSIYQASLHFSPFATPQGDSSLLQEEFRIEDGGLFPGRWAAELLDLNGSGEPSHFLLGHGDGRVQLLELVEDNSNMEVREVASTDSQGFGLNGLASYESGTGQSVLSIDSTGEAKVHKLSDNGTSWDLTLELALPLQALVGNEARIRKTRVFGGESLFIFGSPPHFYQPGGTNGPIIIADPVTLATTVLDADILNEAISYDDDHGLLLLSAKGYVGDVDPSQPLVTANGSQHLQFRKISPYLGFSPVGGVEVQVQGARHFLVVGSGATRQAVLLDQNLAEIAVYDPGNLVKGTPSQVFAHPTDPELVLLQFPSSVQAMRIDPAGPFLVLIDPPVYTASAQIQTARPLLWQGQATLLTVNRYGGIQAQTLGATPQVLFDSTSSVRSLFHGVSCDGAGSCYTINRTNGEVWQLDGQGKLATLVSQEAFGSFCPEATESCAQAPGNALSRFGALRSLIVDDDGSLYPVGQRAARLEVIDAQGESSPGNRIAYSEGGLLLVRDMRSGGCHYLGADTPWSDCDSFNFGVNDNVLNRKTLDPSLGTLYVDVADWVKNAGNTFGHNLRYLEVDGDEIVVATNEAGWIRIFQRPSGSNDFDLVADNRPIPGQDIHYGRGCPALDVRVDPAGAHGVEKLVVYRGCLAQNNTGGSLEGWSLVASGGALPYDLLPSWSLLQDLSPTAVHFIDQPGDELGTLVVGDIWGHLYLFDATDPSVPPTQLLRTESLRGAVATEGFEYFQDSSGDGHLYVTTGRGHYRYLFK
ncbi:MAG: hypothetical protein K0U98_04430 [Deltaproteobacteria bacterium]|nr:hypothetical protein [Deltaproteobacteria bacterium]